MGKNENENCYDVQKLLEMGYHFVNGEPMFNPILAPTMKIVAEILKAPPTQSVRLTTLKQLKHR